MEIKKITYYLLLLLVIILVITTIPPLNANYVYGATINEKEPNNSTSTANSLPLTTIMNGRMYSTQTGGIGGKIDYDYFYFSVPNAGKLSFKLDLPASTSTKNGPEVKILDYKGDDYISFATYMYNQNKTYDQIYLKPGKYYIVLTGQEYDTAFWGKYYSLTLNHTPANAEQEYNNDKSNANFINIGTRYYASLLWGYNDPNGYYGNDYDTDYFYFNLNKKSPINITIKQSTKSTSSGEPMDISLFNYRGDRIYSGALKNYKSATVIKTNTLSNGRYYIEFLGRPKYDYMHPYSVRIDTAPKMTKITKLKKGKKKLTIWWKKISNVTKYQIAYKQKGKSWKYKTVSKSKSKVTIKKLKSKKKYYIKVRSYSTYNGSKNYSKWSKTKTIKTN